MAVPPIPNVVSLLNPQEARWAQDEIEQIERLWRQWLVQHLDNRLDTTITDRSFLRARRNFRQFGTRSRDIQTLLDKLVNHVLRIVHICQQAANYGPALTFLEPICKYAQDCIGNLQDWIEENVPHIYRQTDMMFADAYVQISVAYDVAQDFLTRARTTHSA